MNSRLLEALQRWAAQASPDFRLYVGARGFTATQIVKAIETGSEDGRLLTRMLEKALEEGVDPF